MKKRIFAIILTITLLLAAVPLSVAAEDNVLEIDTSYTLVWANATDSTFTYTFTPEETGIFQFTMDNSGADYVLLNANGEFYRDWYYETMIVCFLEAGTDYQVTLVGNDLYEETTLYFSTADPLTSFEIDANEDDLYASLYSEIVLEYNALPSNDLIAQLTYESDNEAVVTCDSNGNIMAVGEGDATLTVTANGMISDSIDIHVRTPIVKNGVFSTHVYLNARYAQTTYQVTVPEDGTYRVYSVSEMDNCDPHITVFDSEGIETAHSDDVNGYDFDLTLQMEASETYYFLIASYSGLSSLDLVMTKEETVEQVTILADKDEITVAVGDIFAPNYSFLPTSYFEYVTYTSDDSAVIDDSNDGTLVAVGEGTATVTLMSEDGLTDTVEVTVVEPRTMESYQKYTVNTSDGILYAAFVFVPEADGEYIFKSFGDCDTICELYDSTGNLIATGDDTEGGFNFSITETLTAGKTYVLYTGLYSYSDAEYTICVIQPTAAEEVELQVTSSKCSYSQGDTIYVYADTYLSVSVSFGMASEESYTLSGSNPDIWSMSEPYCRTLGETVITVITENGLTDSVKIVVIEEVFGDMDINGGVNMYDVIALYNGVSGAQALTAAESAIAECTGDNAVNMYDVTALYAIVSGAA